MDLINMVVIPGALVFIAVGIAWIVHYLRGLLEAACGLIDAVEKGHGIIRR